MRQAVGSCVRDLQEDRRPRGLLYVATVEATWRAFLQPHAEYFRSKGWRVAVAATWDRSPEGGNLACVPEPIGGSDLPDRIPLRLRRGVRGIFGLMNAAQTIRDVVDSGVFDLVHVHTPVAGLAARLGLRGHRREGRVAVIYTAHGFHFHSGSGVLGNLPWRVLEEQAARLTDWLVVINQEDFQAASAWRSLPRERLVRMPGIGIDCAGYAPGEEHMRSRAAYSGLGIDDSVPIALFIGELNRNKRPHDAIRAIARTPNPPVVLCFAGAGELRPGLEVLAKRLGVDHRVHFLGFRPDVPSLLVGADVVVSCSAREGLPRAILEAMAAGVPVVATDIRGSRDLLGPIGGPLYRAGDDEGLSRHLRSILLDRVLRDRLAAAGRKAAAAYDLKHVLRLHEELYARALEARGGVPMVR